VLFRSKTRLSPGLGGDLQPDLDLVGDLQI